MALNTNPFIEGIDPTSTFGGYASVLLQLVRQAYPSSTYGMILYDTTAPDVLGSNAWRKTCIWINLTLPNTPVISVYKEGTSPGWANITSIIADGSIRTSMIADYNPSIINTGVTLPKLSPAGGTALQLIRVNATATNFEFVSLASLVTVGSIFPSAISGVAVAPGTTRFLGNYNAGTTTWFTANAIVDEIVQGTIPADLIGVPGVLTGRSQFITARTADTFAAYRYFEPNIDILDNTLSGAKLQSGTVYSDRINTTAIANGSYLRVTAGVAAWDPAPTSGITTKFVSTPTAIPIVAGAITPLNHGLVGQPTNVYGVLVCVTAEFGYVANDEVPLDQFDTSFTNNEHPVFYFHATTTQIHCRRTNRAGLTTANATTGANAVLTDGNWNIKFYATYTS